MKKAALAFSLFLTLSSVVITPEGDSTADSPAVLCEVGTATWCTACPKTSAALHHMRQSDSDFYYVTMVTDTNDRAAERIEHYNIAGYPTSFFDGGYEVVFGGKSELSPYQDALQACRMRDRPDVDMVVGVDWLGGGQLQVTVSVTSDTAYQGRLRAYVVEIHSRWNDYAGDPYRYAFLDFALDVPIDVEGTVTKETTWDGSTAGYGDIARDNVMVIAALFTARQHTGYSDPPTNNHPFDAHYVDAVAAARPPPDSPPRVTLIQKPDSLLGRGEAHVSWQGHDDTTPEQELLYSYQLLGYEEQWSSWGRSTEVHYEGLPDGTYTFKVRVRDKAQQEGSTVWSFTVDTRPPRVVTTTPAANARGVSAHTSVTITFSHPMNQGSVADALSVVPSAEVTLHWREETVLLVTPVDGWEEETTYTFTIDTSARRISGQRMSQPFVFSFATAPADTTPPHITATRPASGGVLVSNGTLRLVFSEPMATVFFTRAIHLDPWFPFVLSWEENDTVALITPPFLPPGSYAVTITTFAADKAGNRLPANYTFTFRVERPRIRVTSPADGERGVPVTAIVSITFSQEMNHSSVVAALDLSSLPPLVPTWEGTTLHLTPRQPLLYHTRYVVTVNRSASNVHGVNMTEDYTFSFVTEQGPPSRPSAKEEIPGFSLVVAMAALALVFLVSRKRCAQNRGQRGR